MQYSQEVHREASLLMDQTFNQIQFDLFKKAIGNEWFESIIRPSNTILAQEWFDCLLGESEMKDIKKDFTETEQDKDEFIAWLIEEKEEEINQYYDESEHYPMWNTLFEAKDDWTSNKLEEKADKLYNLGIGVISATDYTKTCLFISGCGYDFYSAHWIPLFIMLEWLKPQEIDKKTEREKISPLTDWNAFGATLRQLALNTDPDTSRHAQGLTTSLKL